MKLPSHTSKRKKFTMYILTYYILISVMFAPIPQLYASSGQANNSSQFSDNSYSYDWDESVAEITFDSVISQDIRPEEVGFDYTPIQDDSNSGDSFAVEDNLSVDHQFALNLTEDSGTITNSYDLPTISDYTNTSLQYGITDMTAIKDYYPLESQTSGGALREKLTWYESVALAQEFEVKWDYSMFYGAKILLNYILGFTTGIYELEILLVNASTTTPYGPNMSSVLSSDVNGPYDSTNTPPLGTSGNIRFFDFTDVLLEKGSYYIVANLTIIDNNDDSTYDHFAWDKYIVAPYDGKTFEMDNATRSWTQQNTYDLTLIPELLASDSNGLALTFSNPNTIDLQDNSAPITSLTSIIQEIGLHTLTANTSTQITFDNDYEFAKSFSASSIFQASNSSYWDYGIDWNISWYTPLLYITPYVNLDRYQLVNSPTDWHDTVFTFYYNDTNTLPGSTRELAGFKVPLSGNYSAGNWILSTTSPNYLSDLVLMDDTTPTERYLLGYWIGTATQSIGHTGSKIVANTLVQSDGAGTPDNVTTGSLNYTLYDGYGNIIPNKGTLLDPLVYADTTSYTLAGITQVSAGFYTPEIYFDPSAYGTDEPGFWTAAVFWQNGTEVGFYSQRIVVQTQTQFDYVWEEEPTKANWITGDISREGLDSIIATGYYFNVSEPYTTGTRNPIPSATVSYNIFNGTWNRNSDLTYEGSAQYNTSILVDFSVGTYTVEIAGTGAFLENNSTSFSLTVFYKLALNPEYTTTSTYYTDNVVFNLALHDVTGDTNLSYYTDLNVTLYDGTSYEMVISTDFTFTHTGAPNEWVLDISTTTKSLDIGLYDVYIEVMVNDYQANYSDVYVSNVYSFEILAAETEIKIDTFPTSIHVYHDAIFVFRFFDTTHSLNLTGAVVTPSANVSSINLVLIPVGETYRLTITNNNDTVAAIEISVTVTLANYETITDFVLGELEVLIINTELVENAVYTPAVSYVGYETTVVIQFNDLTHMELIYGAEYKTFTYNTTSCTFVSLVEWTGGRYNFTFINNDVAAGRVEVTITLGKNGYANALVTIDIAIISKATDADFDTGYSSDIEIYYEEGITVGLLYWDTTLMEYIAQPDTVQIVGNITVTSDPPSNISDTIIIIINPIGTLGVFYLNITMMEPGYAPQMLQIFITVNERTTFLDTPMSALDITDYASEDIEVLFEYQDVISSYSNILTATASADFDVTNSSLDINTYFSIEYNIHLDQYYQIIFTPNTALAVGSVFVIELTFEQYGYETKTVIIHLIFHSPVDYDIAVEIDGELRQLDTFQFTVTIENATQELLYPLSLETIHMAPNPSGDTVVVFYTFYYNDGTEETFNVTIALTGSAGIYAGTSVEIKIPWQVISLSCYVSYTPSAENEHVLLSKSSVESEPEATASPAFLALLAFLFSEYTYYMVGGLAALAVIFIALTIYFAVIRPKKQKKKASKRRYLDKISKILTSVLAMRKVIIVHSETGLPVYEWDLGGEISVDSTLVTGFLQAVAGMGSEISGGQAGSVKKLDYGQFVVSSASKDSICAYLFSTSDVSVDVETGLANFVEWFEKRFKPTLHEWNGITDEFTKNSHQIMDTLSEELFVWTLHPLSVNSMKEKEVVKLNPLSQRIYKFIKDYKEVTISVALEYFNKTPIEETLSTLFNLTDEQFLMRMRLR